ncbi:MAG: TolC family protein [Gammaproteobacteria bacterium]
MPAFPRSLALAGFLLCPVNLPAAQIGPWLGELMQDHERVRSARATVDAAIQREQVARGDWFPTLDVTANVGHERQDKPGGTVTQLDFDELKIGVSQLIYDFGATGAAMEKANIDISLASAGLTREEQSLLLDAVSAWANLIRARDVLAFAKQSEENIRRQTGLEEVRIQAGSGLSTDLLQAKTQLAGAMARRVDSEGGLATARHRFQAVFRKPPPVLEQLQPVGIAENLLPSDLETALAIASLENPDIEEAALQAASAYQDLRASGSAYFPTLEAKFEHNYKDDSGGTVGFQEETLVKLELSYEFNLGFTNINAVAASRLDASAADDNVVETRRGTEEAVRNAWQQLDTARRKAMHLSDQADIAKAFLDLAVEERTLGQRSLIDVLSGETSWINARSDAVAARTDVVLAAAELLRAIGRFTPDTVITTPSPPMAGR